MSVDTAERVERGSEAPRSLGRRVLRGTGWTLIGLGLVVLLFVAYELWGTNLITARHQNDLKGDLAQQFRQAETGGPRQLKPIPGDALGIIRIPDIKLNVAIVEGVSVEDLRKGPGHYPDSPLPGEDGNFALAGHRTTYGAPFWSLDELEEGDKIQIRTVEGRYVYEVRWQRVVRPDQVELLDPTEVPSLTLTTCNPRFSAAERLIIRAELVKELPPPDTI